MALLRALAFAVPLILAAAGAQAAETFCSCATDAGTAGTFKNSECQNTIGTPRMAGTIEVCLDFEGSEWTALTGSNSLTDACTTSGVSERAGGSLWADEFGGNAAGCGWAHGETFSVGTSPNDLRINDANPCGGGNCPCGDEAEPAVWLNGDPLEAGTNACLGVVLANDVDDLFSGATTPSTPLAGSNSLVQIVQTGQTNGIWDGDTMANTHTFAMSKLSAYPSNIASTNILTWPWKHDQHGNNDHPFDMWLGTANGYSTAYFPFVGMSVYNFANCTASRSSATYTVGSIGDTACNGSQLRITGPQNYTRSTDWPYGQAGCVQGFIRGYGTSTAEWKILFTPLGGSRKTIFHIQNLDMSGISNSPSPFRPNAYANANQGGGETPTTAPTGRFTDNLLIQSWPSGTAPADVEAAMPTCDQMQFSAGEPPPTPTITIDQLTPSDATPAYATAFTLDVAYTASDTTGTITCSADLENDGGYEDGSDTGASVQTITGLSYSSSGAKTIGVRCVDESTASDTETVGVTVSEQQAPAPPTLVPSVNKSSGGSVGWPSAF